MTHNLNTIPENSGVDRIQAAAIMINARQKEKEAAERTVAQTPVSRRDNSMERAVVANILRRDSEAIAVASSKLLVCRATSSKNAIRLFGSAF